MRGLLALTALVLLSIGVGLGLLAAVGRDSTALPITLQADGIDSIHFGTQEFIVVAKLKDLFGSPSQIQRPFNNGECDVNAWVTWPTLAAYFLRSQFVGYNTGYGGEPLTGTDPAATTTDGLRVGDTLADAERLYPSAVTTGFQNGGDVYYISTQQGRFVGYLSTQGAQPLLPSAVIQDVTAGGVGCPAVSS